MIEITIIKEQDDFVGVKTKGHAMFDEHGKDIVCSAVSVLIINTINSMEAFAGCDLSVSSSTEDGIIDCNINKPSNDSNLLMKSLVLGLESVKMTYSDEYLQINIKEV